MNHLRKIYWAIIHRIIPQHRYHVIKPRTLKPGYHDPDTQIRAAAFDIMSEHAESLMGDGLHGTKWEEGDIPETDAMGRSNILDQIRIESELIMLRNWWVNDRDGREDKLMSKIPLTRPNFSLISSDERTPEEDSKISEYLTHITKVQQQLDEEDEEKFITLVRLLPNMWN